MRILWITPKWTLPVTDGARVATDSLIRSVIACGGVIDYWSLSNQDDKIDISEMLSTWGVKSASSDTRSLPSTSFHKKCYYLKKLLTNPFVPLTFSSFCDGRFLKIFLKKISDHNYDFIILDGLHLGVLLNGLNSEVLQKVIYRAHNIEADLWYKSFKGAKNPVIKFFFWTQFKLVQKFEMSLSKRVKGVAAIAQEDFEVLKSWGANVRLAPLGLKFRELPHRLHSEETNFVFIGRLDWPPNRDGLKWLLDEVWPEVIKRRADARLSIYGSGDRSWLAEYFLLKNVELKGFIPEIIDAYRDADFTLVPVFYGSGTRIKVIESFAMNRRLISTSMGVQGAGLAVKDYLAAESSEEWINILSQIKPSEEDQQSLEDSINRLKLQFDEFTIGQKFYQWLKEL